MSKSILTEQFIGLEKTNEILDKIFKYGILSITKNEKLFLDAVSIGDMDSVNIILNLLDRDTILEDRYFKFELDEIVYDDDCIEYVGVLYVPDLYLNDDNDERIEGNLIGKIVLFNTGDYSIEFEKTVIENGEEVQYDVFEFCSGLEYELDSFIDYIIQELE
jgi:hypothetical protein